MKKYIPFMAFAVMTVFSLAFVACGDDDEEEPVVVPDLPADVPTTVSSPTYLDAGYSGSSHATSDIRNFAAYSTKMVNLRWQIYKNLTGDFNASKGFVGEYNAADWDRFLEVAFELYENADDYVEAIQSLIDQGILTENVTRGLPSATAIGSELKNINDALGTGHKKILDVMRRPGMATQEQWEAAYDALPKELRYGASDWKEWRSNVYNNNFGGGISNNLHASRTYMYLCNENGSSKSKFADEANLMCSGHPGLTHVAQVGDKLVSSGIKVNIAFQKAINPMFGNFMDGIDIGMASTSLTNAVHKGDAGEARDAMLTISNVVVGQLGNFADSPYLLNEGINISTEAFRQTMLADLNDAEALYSNSASSNVGIVQASDNGSDGKPAGIYIVDSPSGGVHVAFADDKGNAAIPSNNTGNATITGVDADGNVGKSTVSVTSGKVSVVAITTVTEVNDELPANGYLKLSRPDVDFTADEDAMSVGFTTNYHYMGFKPSESWISAFTRSSLKGQFVVSVKENDTGKDREGKLLVLATDKAGNVQKSAVLIVRQEAGLGGITLTSEEMSFAYNKYSKTNYVTLTGWPYFGAFTEKEADEDWISFDCDQGLKYFTVTVEENKTGKPRQATCYVYGCNDLDRQYGSNEVQKVPFIVKQEAEGTLTLTSQNLSFDVEGGSETLRATIDGYKMLGSVIDTDGQGWLDVTPHGDSKTVDVVCSKNEMGLDRTGHFYVFGTNFNDPLVGDCKMVRVAVAQTAEEKQPNLVITGVSELKLDATLILPYKGSTESTALLMPSYIHFNNGENDCTITQSGSDVQVYCAYQEIKGKNEHTYSLSFDISDFKGDCSKATIHNIRYRYAHEYKGSTDGFTYVTVDGQVQLAHEEDFTVESIDKVTANINYDGESALSFRDNNAKLNNFVYKTTWFVVPPYAESYTSTEERVLATDRSQSLSISLKFNCKQAVAATSRPVVSSSAVETIRPVNNPVGGCIVVTVTE